MKLRLHRSGAAEPVDDLGQTPTIDVRLIYDGPSRAELRMQIATNGDTEIGTVWTFTIPRFWITDVISRAFYFDGAPVSLGDVLDDESERGNVAREDAVLAANAPMDVYYGALRRRNALTLSGVASFERLLRKRLPSFIQKLIEDAVTEVRRTEEKKARVPLPWSEQPVPMPRRRGGQPDAGGALGYYLKVRARQLRTGESLLRIFSESQSEERMKTRYYDGQRIYRFMRTLR
jgi:hypothetical protein